MPTDAEVDGVGLHARDVTWKDLLRLDAQPPAAEVRSYFLWKESHSRGA